MEGDETPKKFMADLSAAPQDFPTHLHPPEFWEELGRTVGTFGFLEMTLGRAIFAVTGTREIPEAQAEEELPKWAKTLEQALKNSLNELINDFGEAVRHNPRCEITNLDVLLSRLSEVSKLRNVLCHGSWDKPNEKGQCSVFFVNRKLMAFDTLVDISFLRQLRASVCELIAAVVTTVTIMGYQFPGSNGPGIPVFVRQ